MVKTNHEPALVFHAVAKVAVARRAIGKIMYWTVHINSNVIAG